MKLTLQNGELILPEDFSFELTFNHPFFSDEGASSIPVEIPACAENLALLDFPSRLGATYTKITRFPAILSHGPLSLDGSLLVGGVSSTGDISCTFVTRESVMFSELQDKKLKDLFSKKTAALGGNTAEVRGSTLDSVWRAHFGKMLDKYGADHPGLVAFPVLVTKDDFGFEMVNPINAADDGLDAGMRTLTGDSGNSVTVPYAYGVTPFILLWRMLELTFTLAGYDVVENVFKEDILKDIVVLNNCVDSCVGEQLNYSDLVPSITVGELIIWLKDKFGAYVCLDKKQVRICLLSHLIEGDDGAEDIDLSPFSDLDSEQIELPTAKGLVIDCDKSLDGAAPPEDVSIEDYMKTYGNCVYVYANIDSAWGAPSEIEGPQGYTEPRTAFLDSGQFARCVRMMPEDQLSYLDSEWVRPFGSMAFKYSRAGEFEPVELKTDDRYCPTVIRGSKSYLYIGDAIHAHTSLDGTTEKETEQPIMICLQMPRYTNDGIHYYGYSQDSPGPDYTPTMLTPDGIYHLFWRRYNQMLRASAPEVKVNIQLPIKQLINVDFSKRKIYRHQSAILKSLSLIVSDKGIISGESILTIIPPHMYDINDKDAFAPECLRWKIVNERPDTMLSAGSYVYNNVEEYYEEDAANERLTFIGRNFGARPRSGAYPTGPNSIDVEYWLERFVAVFKD